MKMGPSARYEYLLKRAADREELWSLWDGGWALLGDKESGEYVPVWPHGDYAAAYAVREWNTYQPRAIPLEQWLTKWTAGMETDNRRVAVFPTLDEPVAVVEPGKFRADLEAEMSQFE
ncbi:MAG TPA: DUF2750 domain-containing protein [Acidobacteriaceae bacterium]|jgi:hypothetical protein|nr:DUF2750 domain-containing protein [Acidobacteriaceae bacterium]